MVFEVVDLQKSKDWVEEATPKGYDIVFSRRRGDFLEELFQSAFVGILQEHVVGAAVDEIPVESNQPWYEALVAAGGQDSSERADLIGVVRLGVSGTVGLQDVGVCVSKAWVLGGSALRSFLELKWDDFARIPSSPNFRRARAHHTLVGE